MHEAPQSGDELRVGALTRLSGFVSLLGEDLSRDLASPGSDGGDQRARCQRVVSRQEQVQELRQLLNDVRETSPEELQQILRESRGEKKGRESPGDKVQTLESVAQELHDAIRKNVRLARREAVLEAYCEEQQKALRSVESSESRLKRDLAAQQAQHKDTAAEMEMLVQSKKAAEREALELKVSWKKDRMELHQLQCELQKAASSVATLEAHKFSDQVHRLPTLVRTSEAEAQEVVQRKIFQERCVELQAKLDKSRVTVYEKGRELEMLRIQFEEQRRQLLDQDEQQQSFEKEKQLLQDKIISLLETQIGESYGADAGSYSDTPLLSQTQQQLAEVELRHEELERHYAVANAAKDGLAKHCSVLQGKLEELQEALEEKAKIQDHHTSKHASLEERLALANQRVQDLHHENSAFHQQFSDLVDEKQRHEEHFLARAAVAESSVAEQDRRLKDLKEKYLLVEKCGLELLPRAGALPGTLQVLMTELDKSISHFISSSEASGDGMVLTEMVCHLQKVATESAAEAAKQRAEVGELMEECHKDRQSRLQLEAAAEAPEARHAAHVAQLPIEWSSPGLEESEPESIPEEYAAIIARVVLHGWGAVEWGGNFTLLHWAAMQKRHQLCRALLELRADPSVKDDDGMTAADYAAEKGSREILFTLENALPPTRAPQHAPIHAPAANEARLRPGHSAPATKAAEMFARLAERR